MSRLGERECREGARSSVLAGNGGSPTVGGGAPELESGGLGALSLGFVGQKNEDGEGYL